MANVITGSFSGTGQSAVCVGRSIAITMDFAGTASVDIEQLMPSGAWIKVATAIVADYSQVFNNGAVASLRLNCTAYTNAVEYALIGGTGE